MNLFYYASLTLEVVVRDRGSYNIYMTKIFQEVALVFITKYFFVSTNLANVFDRASPLNSFGFSTTFVPYLVRFHSNLENLTTGHCFSKYLLTQSREVLKSYCPESRGNWAVSKTPSTISLASPHVECWICHTTFQKSM